MNFQRKFSTDEYYLLKLLENNAFLIKELTRSGKNEKGNLNISSPYQLRARTLVYLLIRKLAVRFRLVYIVRKLFPVSKVKNKMGLM